MRNKDELNLREPAVATRRRAAMSGQETQKDEADAGFICREESRPASAVFAPFSWENLPFGLARVVISERT